MAAESLSGLLGGRLPGDGGRGQLPQLTPRPPPPGAPPRHQCQSTPRHYYSCPSPRLLHRAPAAPVPLPPTPSDSERRSVSAQSSRSQAQSPRMPPISVGSPGWGVKELAERDFEEAAREAVIANPRAWRESFGAHEFRGHCGGFASREASSRRHLAFVNFHSPATLKLMRDSSSSSRASSRTSSRA
eukprot:TRINITY_DN65888_c0_g1_i1.p1 TRINITY_DN65888_c0_g1~~TRINITY_DN65888_c0_g1_i1.p1  ORF type:complete len:211 (+),score=41.90 TRINITY_DN65888_c0_g1_i1:74-634(+)